MKKFAVVKRLKDNKYCPYRMQNESFAETLIEAIIDVTGEKKEDYSIELITPEQYKTLDIADDLY